MANVPKNEGVGDKISPSFRQPTERMQSGAKHPIPIPADASPKASVPGKMVSLASDLKNTANSTPPIGSCVQTLWFSFFFDGTGNNLDADLGSLKHSNVAKLYRAHKGNEDNGGVEKKTGNTSTGIYRIYVPGIGTYFKAINDDGGSDAGLGAGSFGTERLDWASDHFDEKMKTHLALAKNPANAIVELNIAVFGFSRGSALARAFIHEFVGKRCRQVADKKLRMKSGDYPVRIRFVGLFDTVASVGLAMSANNMEKLDALKGDVNTHISNRLTVYHDIRPEVLAFAKEAKAGADPAPGKYDGHLRWGGLLEIPETVEEVRHFIAAHEIRNSFPVDSIRNFNSGGKIVKPDRFFEYVYPGVHSDIGGSYRPGEGGKNEEFNTKIGLIPLAEMYKFALACGVPFLSRTAWAENNVVDFQLDADVIKDYSYYSSKLNASAHTVGDLFNAHMRLYYEWRFYSINRKRKGDRSEADRISRSDAEFKKENLILKREIEKLQGAEISAQGRLTSAEWKVDDFISANGSYSDDGNRLEKLRGDVDEARLAHKSAKDAVLRAKAKMLALPQTSDLASVISIYDKQLMLDAQAIYDVLADPRLSTSKHGFSTVRASLRPHYKILVAAYENEFIKNEGLSDIRIISFFEKYIHDSLAGFAKDGTLPSDPRVVYVGGDEKLQYARLDQNENDSSMNRVA